MVGEEFAAANDSPAGMMESTLIGPACGIADDDGQNIDTEAVVVGMSKSEVQE